MYYELGLEGRLTLKDCDKFEAALSFDNPLCRSAARATSKR